jgi:predicted deacylase
MEKINIKNIKINTKEVFYVEICKTPGGSPIILTLLVVKGNKKGPILVVSGGVHGDEYEGPLTIIKLYHELKIENINGTFVGLVVANVPAFEAASRCSPIDGLNLARIFPGKSNGSVTEKIAFWMGDSLIKNSDYYIDLHSSGSDMEMPQMCGYIIRDKSKKAFFSKKMAEAFNATVTWAHKDSGEGRTLSFARDHDIPSIYTECPASRNVALEDTDAYLNGTKNIMKLTKMIKGDFEGQPSKYYLSGDGNTENSIKSTTSGFFIPSVKILEKVKKNMVLGVVMNLTGEIIEEIKSPNDGYIGLRRLLPTVHSGDNIFLLAERFIDEKTI